MSTPSRKPSLLVITSETSEAERLLGALREAGLADHSVSIPSADRLEGVIKERGCDLILCCSYDKDLDLDGILAAYGQITTDTPLILIADPSDWSAIADKGRRAGARELTRRHDSEHLKIVVAREYSDLLKRREAEGLAARLQSCEKSMLSMLEVTSAGVAFVQDGLHIDANPAYVRLFGYSATDDILAIPLLDLIASADQKKIRDLLKKAEQSKLDGPATLDVTCVRADSSELAARALASPSEIDGESCVRLIIQPLQAALAEQQVEEVKIQPYGLGASSFLAQIDSHIDETRTVEQPFAIFFVKINKSAELLRDMALTLALELFEEFGRRLSEIVGDRGVVTRINDDGFAIIVDGLGELDARGFSEHLKEAARLSSHAVHQDKTTADCDIGYFIVSDRAAAAEDILNAAHRLCLGHAFGRDGQTGKEATTSLAARTKQENADDDAAMARKIEYALRNEQLKLVYQPIISLMGDNQENYSVLLRLLDEDENLLEARDFIGAAIRTGSIEEIDKWTIRAAIRVIGEQRKAGHNLSLFVNLSEDTFRNPSIVLWICDCLREFDVRGNWLTFQFQEELVVGNLTSIGKLVETLKKIKCRVAINRFGATERPEMLLQGLTLDYVLLKASFAQNLADDTNKQQRLLQLAGLAREYNVRSIVTGVEDARALTVLWTAGVDYVQGNFLQRPSPTLEVQT